MGLHRAELVATPLVPEAPQLLGDIDDGTWVIFVMDQVDGLPPVLPWRVDQLQVTVDALDRLHDRPAPPGLPPAEVTLGDLATGWADVCAPRCRPAVPSRQRTAHRQAGRSVGAETC